MNAQLDERWRVGQRPFNGLIVVSPAYPIAELLRTIRPVVRKLRAQYGASRLYTFEDWHEHDGYLMSETEATWDELLGATASETSLVAWSSDDTFVRRAWYPEGYSFLLRWCVSRDPDDFYPAPAVPHGAHSGLFDLTGEASFVRHVSSNLIIPPTEPEPAAGYFEKAYAG